ncbi:unnamed protein product [Ceratitis capitata]|uniref:(Mediterranean fruit fly) hypothetical protein n=1 Tax=Ceratitis capitata TaxID=7213 RepID=A0A811VGM5_CERCA|nr:unnamed protein product [Ceratitis capitata]
MTHDHDWRKLRPQCLKISPDAYQEELSGAMKVIALNCDEKFPLLNLRASMHVRVSAAADSRTQKHTKHTRTYVCRFGIIPIAKPVKEMSRQWPNAYGYGDIFNPTGWTVVPKKCPKEMVAQQRPWSRVLTSFNSETEKCKATVDRD